jgi:branched-chain amino acid transport system substrate-binding protein
MSRFLRRHEMSYEPNAPISRRRLLQAAPAAAASAASLHAPWVWGQGAGTIKIGYVSPLTGPLAAFAEPDKFTLEQVRKATAGGIVLGGRKYAVEIVYKDSQSNPNKAGSAAAELITRDKVDLVIASATPATVNPVADQCELNGVPCITNDAPWQPWFFGRGGDPKKGFEWTYHFFWGLEDIIGVFASVWSQLGSNKTWSARCGPTTRTATPGATPRSASRSTLAAAKKLQGGGQAAASSRPSDDFSSLHCRVQEAQRLRDRHRRGAAAGLRQLLEPGRRSQGFKPKICHCGQGHRIPGCDRCLRGPRAEGLTVELMVVARGTRSSRP